jgi:hypothetical protein
MSAHVEPSTGPPTWWRPTRHTGPGSSPLRAVVDQFGPSDISKIAADFDVAAQQAN